jgi:DNA repair exonuclease SbcCD ATPase subunit
MIKFNSVKYQNFLSAGSAPIQIALSKTHLNLISGKNGSGKSSVSDSICFALFGKAYRNINKNQLINSINGKKCLVEVEFETNSKKYKVVRGMKPNVFEIWENGVMLNQNPSIKDHQKVLETQILKMNYRAFTQIVIMGSGSYVPFMMLTPAHRREFIEDLLDIRIFSVMNTLLKEKVKTTTETLRDVQNEIKLLKEKATLQQSFIEKRMREQSQSMDTIANEIIQIETRNQATQATIDKLLVEVDSKMAESELHATDDKLHSIKITHKRLVSEYKETLSQKEFYEGLDNCPTCGQTVHDEHKEKIIGDVIVTLDTHKQNIDDMEKSISELTAVYEHWRTVEVEISGLNKQVTELNKVLHSDNMLLNSFRKQHQTLSTDTSSIDEEKAKLKDYAKQIVAYDKQKKMLLDDREHQSVALALLQDSGIKSKIIKQYIPVINKLINKFLDKLDFFCQFHLDENFNESVKSRHRDEFSYNSFSEGQKLRIDLALIFTWREIARMKNSVTCNLVFFDEIFDSSLDGAGMDLALGLLDNMKDSNVFVVSHRDSNVDKYPNVIYIDMRNNFSYVKD